MGCSASFLSDTGPNIIMLGLDKAGKTTILYRMKLDMVVTTIPTIGFNAETIKVKKRSYLVRDFGGQDVTRKTWKQYFSGVKGIVYVVDSSDEDRIEMAKKELFNVIKHEELKKVPLVVMANKQDLPNAMKLSEVAKALSIDAVTGRKWFIEGTCATTGDGIKGSMKKLAKFIKKQK